MLEPRKIYVKIHTCLIDATRAFSWLYVRTSALIFDVEFNIEATDCKTQTGLPTQGNEPFNEATDYYTYEIS